MFLLVLIVQPIWAFAYKVSVWILKVIAEADLMAKLPACSLCPANPVVSSL